MGLFESMDILFTTEPEAAFSAIIANNPEALQDKDNVLIIDGGDGTIDYLHVKKFDKVWSK